jgi:O-antigen ligase
MVFQDPRYGLSPIARSNVHLHNNFTQIAAERGLPALAAWLTFIAWAFVSLLRMLKNRASRRSPFPLAAAASIVALITAGFFEYNFGDSEVVILFLFMVTLPFTLSRTGDVE